MTNLQRTPSDLQEFITANALTAQWLADIGHTPTVPAAALALGVASEQIIKTLLFLVDAPAADTTPGERPPAAVVVISNGERRVDTRLLASHLGVSKKRVRLAPAETVLRMLGYPAGGVPPFGHATTLPVILDATVLTAAAHYDGVLYGGGGDDRTMLRVTLTELLKVVQPEVVAVS
jgi:prolyl-tRNA editing enzyme YbaK/EbsC (Cys-tRNA(Pro) deacylase)